MTDIQKRAAIDEAINMLAELGRDFSEDRQGAINHVIEQLRQVEKSLRKQ